MQAKDSSGGKQVCDSIFLFNQSYCQLVSGAPFSKRKKIGTHTNKELNSFVLAKRARHNSLCIYNTNLVSTVSPFVRSNFCHNEEKTYCDGTNVNNWYFVYSTLYWPKKLDVMKWALIMNHVYVLLVDSICDSKLNE